TREFQHHRAVAQRRLRGEENASLRSTPQFDQQAKVAQFFSSRWETSRGETDLQKRVAFEKNSDLLAPLREAAHDVRCGHLLPIFLAQAEFFIDQLDSRFGSAEFRVKSQVVLDHRALPRTPAPA